MAILLKELPSLSTLLSAYASISAMAMLFRTIINEMVPEWMRTYIASKLSELISSYFSSEFTFFIADHWRATDNRLFRAAEVYLPTIIGPSIDSLFVGSNDSSDPPAPPERSMPPDCTIMDYFEGIRLKWTFSSKEAKKNRAPNERCFSLTCEKSARERVEQAYFPHVIKKAQALLKEPESLSIYTYNNYWDSAVFKHPATFETLAMEPNLKQFILDDLNSFVKRKEFFKNVGRAWKRGYLLYGPPGTGKSSLVAAIANYMRYDIYDLQLQSVRNDADLRDVLTSTRDRSILLIEDIDCSANISHDRSKLKEKHEDEEDDESNCDSGVTPSGMLNFIDGLWAAFGNERIIIFTTNHKENLDPALLRPGRMDVHIYMGYCTPAVFRQLSASYLGIKDDKLIGSIDDPIQSTEVTPDEVTQQLMVIDDLIQSIEVTPAEVAQQLMASNDPKTALEGLTDFLNSKKKEEEEKSVKEKEEKKKKEEEEKSVKEKEEKKKKKKKGKRREKKQWKDKTHLEQDERIWLD